MAQNGATMMAELRPPCASLLNVSSSLPGAVRHELLWADPMLKRPLTCWS